MHINSLTLCLSVFLYLAPLHSSFFIPPSPLPHPPKKEKPMHDTHAHVGSEEARENETKQPNAMKLNESHFNQTDLPKIKIKVVLPLSPPTISVFFSQILRGYAKKVSMTSRRALPLPFWRGKRRPSRNPSTPPSSTTIRHQSPPYLVRKPR